MTDEVTRLRRLRKMALRTRALSSFLGTGRHRNGLYERAAVLNWRIARIATGTLRSHPYESYQKDQGMLESGVDRWAEYCRATLANLRGRGMESFLEACSAAARELDDSRALTLSADLSDALGRAQHCMRELIDEARAQVMVHAGEIGEARSTSESTMAGSPYIAL